MKQILFLIAVLCSPLYGQIKFSELPAKTAGSSTASQIFFPLVEMDGTPSTHRMSAVELGNLVGASISDGDKGAIVVTSGVWGFDPVVVTPFSQTLLDDTSAANWRSTLGLGSAATSAASEFAAVAHAHSATDITSGTVLTARLGSGTANDGKFLRGDSTWSSLLPEGIALGGTTPGVNLPLINSGQVWSSGVTHYGWVLDIQDGGAAAASRTIQVLRGGVEQWSVDTDGRQYNEGVCVASDGSFGWSNTEPPTTGTTDTLLYRDAARVIAMRSDTQAQQFRVYNTYTSGTNYERATLDWQTTTNTFRFGTQKGSGGGTARDMSLVTDDTVRVTIGATDGVTTFSANQIRVTTSKTPSSASDTGVAGTICWDSGFLYVCTATNTWKRVAIATW